MEPIKEYTKSIVETHARALDITPEEYMKNHDKFLKNFEVKLDDSIPEGEIHIIDKSD